MLNPFYGTKHGPGVLEQLPVDGGWSRWQLSQMANYYAQRPDKQAPYRNSWWKPPADPNYVKPWSAGAGGGLTNAQTGAQMLANPSPGPVLPPWLQQGYNPSAGQPVQSPFISAAPRYSPRVGMAPARSPGFNYSLPAAPLGGYGQRVRIV